MHGSWLARELVTMRSGMQHNAARKLNSIACAVWQMIVRASGTRQPVCSSRDVDARAGIQKVLPLNQAIGPRVV